MVGAAAATGGGGGGVGHRRGRGFGPAVTIFSPLGYLLVLVGGEELEPLFSLNKRQILPWDITYTFS